MTNNLKMINRLTDLIKEIDNIRNEVMDIIIKLETTDPIPEEPKLYDNSKDYFCTNIINKFLRENGTLLDKELQSKLYNKLSYVNINKLKLWQLLNHLEFGYEYIEGKEWKDIKIDIKELPKKEKKR